MMKYPPGGPMGKNKQAKDNQKPIRQPLKAMKYVFISAASLLIAVAVLMIYIYVDPGKEKIVFYVLLFPLGFAASAFLFGAMRGFAVYSGKVLSGKLELTGPVVVFFLVMVFGFQLISSDGPFGFTVYLKDVEGNTVFKKDQALVRLFLDNKPETGRTDDDGAVDFKAISPGFKNRTVPVELEVERWVFTNGKKSDYIVLKGNNAELVIMRDSSLETLSGWVTDVDSKPIEGAGVAVKSNVTYTDQNGWFTLTIPPQDQEEKQWVIVQKTGYKTCRDYGYPGNPDKPTYILKKEEQ